MSITERLDEILDEPYVPQQSEHWKIEDKGGANWALRKVAKIDGKIAEISDYVAEKKAKLDALLESECGQLQRDREYFTSHLADYHRMVLAEDEKAKTIKLDDGALVSRKQPDGVDIPDPEAVMAWARENAPAYIRYPLPPAPQLERNAIKEAVLKGGEIIPGVTAVTGEVKFDVAPS